MKNWLKCWAILLGIGVLALILAMILQSMFFNLLAIVIIGTSLLPSVFKKQFDKLFEGSVEYE